MQIFCRQYQIVFEIFGWNLTQSSAAEHSNVWITDHVSLPTKKLFHSNSNPTNVVFSFFPFSPRSCPALYVHAPFTCMAWSSPTPIYRMTEASTL